MPKPKEKDMDLRIDADPEETEETSEEAEDTEETTEETEDTEETTEEETTEEATEEGPDPIAALTAMVESLAQSVQAIAERVSVMDGVSVDMGEGTNAELADVDDDGTIDSDDLDILESREDIEDFDLTI
jgi:hypothetical protein